MADVFTAAGTFGDMGNTGLGKNLATLAYDKLVEINLRTAPMFRAIADKKVGSLTHNGPSIRFQFYTDIAETDFASALLDELVDPEFVQIPETSYIDITEQEIGRVVMPTKKLALMTLADVQPWIANAVSFNMIKTINNGVAAVLDGGSQSIHENGGALKYNDGATSDVTDTDFIQSRTIRNAKTKLDSQSVVPRSGNMYVSYIHPEVSADLRAETGNATWRTPQEYQNIAPLLSGELGAWEGVRFIETPTMTNDTVGNGGARVFNTYVLGQQALAEAVWQEPKIEFGNISDRLNRFRPVGWVGNLNWAVYRQEALLRIETCASGLTT